jgi:hypothetical protein
VRFSIREVVDNQLPAPVPIAAPWLEVTATTLEFRIDISSMRDVPDRLAYPAPSPEPSDELVASTCELQIKTTPIDALDRERLAYPAPIPQPQLELFARTLEFEIVRFSIRTFALFSASVVPIPHPTLELCPVTCEFETRMTPIDELD